MKNNKTLIVFKFNTHLSTPNEWLADVRQRYATLKFTIHCSKLEVDLPNVTINHITIYSIFGVLSGCGGFSLLMFSGLAAMFSRSFETLLPPSRLMDYSLTASIGFFLLSTVSCFSFLKHLSKPVEDITKD